MYKMSLRSQGQSVESEKYTCQNGTSLFKANGRQNCVVYIARWFVPLILHITSGLPTVFATLRNTNVCLLCF